MSSSRRLLQTIFAVLPMGMSTITCLGAQITLNDPYQWLENRSTNTLGRAPGLRQNLGVTSAVPNGLAGTTATATQGSTVLLLPYTGTSAISNEFNRTIAANPTMYGAWQLLFTNGANTASVSTPAINPTLAPMPFAGDVRITNQTSTSFSWTIPTTASVDAVRINLFDHGRLNLAGTNADIIYNATFAANTTSFTLPSTLVNGLPLISGNLYTLEINLLDFASNSVSASQNDLRNRSRLYVDFLPGSTPARGAFLPVVEPGANGSTPIFHFNITSVGRNTIYIDPVVATGYIYKTGTGNPNFASVLLPTGIGDNRYKIVLQDGSEVDVTGGTTFSFANGGVSAFTVLGIEASAGLDVSDPTAFITGLTFTQSGAFTGTMQAIAIVPEVHSSIMLITGLGCVLAVSRRQRRITMRAVYKAA